MLLNLQSVSRELGGLSRQLSAPSGEAGVGTLTLVGAESGRKRSWEQRATLGPRVCSRPRCGRAFQPRLTGGHPQAFCSPGCRVEFTNECRRTARARAKPKSTGTRRPEYWLSGVDVATGRRVPVVVQTPAEGLTRMVVTKVPAKTGIAIKPHDGEGA